jgi:hypothetical protein
MGPQSPDWRGKTGVVSFGKRDVIIMYLMKNNAAFHARLIFHIALPSSMTQRHTAEASHGFSLLQIDKDRPGVRLNLLVAARETTARVPGTSPSFSFHAQNGKSAKDAECQRLFFMVSPRSLPLAFDGPRSFMSYLGLPNLTASRCTHPVEAKSGFGIRVATATTSHAEVDTGSAW